MVELESAGTGAVVQGIASQTYDVGIASAAISDSLIQAEPLFETSVVLVMAFSPCRTPVADFPNREDHSAFPAGLWLLPGDHPARPGPRS